MSTKVTPEFRGAYPKVFKPELNKLSGKTEFSIVALFSKGADLSSLVSLAQEAIVEKWGPDKAKWPANLKTPFRKHEDRMKEGVLPDGYEPGGIYITLKNKNKPSVVDDQVQAILDETLVYGGAYFKASVRAFAYDQAGNRGVSFSLNNLQKTREGKPFGNRTTPEQDFAPVTPAAGSTAGATSADSLFG